MPKNIDKKVMFCSNSSNQMNEELVRLNGWAQVVPRCMPWAANHTVPNIDANSAVNYDLNTNVMQFTAHNAINSSLNAQMNSPFVNSSINTSVTTRDIESALKVLSPDPCTSQTATHWELLNNVCTGRQTSHQHLKRRNDSSDEELEEGIRRPVKQYISEEKVSAIFNKLQITNNDMFDVNEKIECEDFEEVLDESSTEDNPMIFTNELQNAIKTQTMTDKMVKNEFDKHSKAVVIWRPNNPLLPIRVNPSSNVEDVDESDSKTDSNKTNDNIATDSDIETIDFTPEEEFIDYDNDMELCP